MATITAPEDGDEVVVDTQMFVTGRATDPVGITRVQLLANGQIVKTVSSESPAGQNTFDVLLDYTPHTIGSVDLQLIAYRGALASDPADITINVRSNQAQVTATIQQIPNVPVIDPNDPTCRALTNAGLNVRTGPSTVYDKITTLAAGTVVPIIGRISTNEWWQIRYGTTTGWVSAAYTSVYGICTGVPTVTAPPTPTSNAPTAIPPTWTPQATFTPKPTNTPGVPDLVITSIAGNTSITLPDDANQTYSVTITNTGSGPSGSFENTFTGPDGATVDLGAVSGLDAGQSIVLTVTVAYTTTGNFTLSAKADSANQVTEVSEVNNSASLSVVVS